MNKIEDFYRRQNAAADEGKEYQFFYGFDYIVTDIYVHSYAIAGFHICNDAIKFAKTLSDAIIINTKTKKAIHVHPPVPVKTDWQLGD
jgi:hypothetical protein